MNWSTLKSSGFAFAQPWWLLLLLAIPLLALLRGRLGGKPAVLFSSTAPLRELGSRVKSRAGSLLTSLLFLSLALFVIALARPQFGKTTSHIQASGVDIMLLLDVSASMLLEDFQIGNDRASRIDTVKQVTHKFIEERPNDRIGIIAFAGRPYLVSPLTLDHDWLLQNLDRIRIGLVEDGTAIGSAVASGANRLKDREAKSKLIVLLTDGDNNAGKITPLTAAEAAKTLGIKVYTIGAGTTNPAPFPVLGRNHQPVRDMFGNPRYEMRQFGFDEKTLKEIADVTGARYFRAADVQSLNAVYSEIDKLEKSTIETTQRRDYRDLFPWFVGTGLAMLATRLVMEQTIWRRLP